LAIPSAWVRNQSVNPFELYNNFNYIRVRSFILNGAPSTAEHFPEKDESTKTIRREVTLLALS
jgi:hypothetical protein